MEFGSSQLEISIRTEYREHVQEQLARFGIPTDVADVEMRAAGVFEGRPVFLAMVRLVKWHRKPSLRLLLGLPLLELNVRRALQNTWLVGVSHFGGLWLHPSSQLAQSNAAAEIRTLVAVLESDPKDTPDAPEVVAPADTDPAWRSWPAGVTDVAPLSNEPKR